MRPPSTRELHSSSSSAPPFIALQADSKLSMQTSNIFNVFFCFDYDDDDGVTMSYGGNRSRRKLLIKSPNNKSYVFLNLVHNFFVSLFVCLQNAKRNAYTVNLSLESSSLLSTVIITITDHKDNYTICIIYDYTTFFIYRGVATHHYICYRLHQPTSR